MVELTYGSIDYVPILVYTYEVPCRNSALVSCYHNASVSLSAFFSLLLNSVVRYGDVISGRSSSPSALVFPKRRYPPNYSQRLVDLFNGVTIAIVQTSTRSSSDNRALEFHERHCTSPTGWTSSYRLTIFELKLHLKCAMAVKLLAILCLVVDLSFVFPSDLVSGHHRLVRRRMGMEHPTLPTVVDLPGEYQTLLGQLPGSLLAAAEPCAAQDLADKLVTQSKADSKLSATTKAQILELAKAICAAEHNTHPDYQNNMLARNSLYCLKTPQNSEIDHIFPKQDPANDKIHFVDPKTRATILLDQIPETRTRDDQRGGNVTNTIPTPEKVDPKSLLVTTTDTNATQNPMNTSASTESQTPLNTSASTESQTPPNTSAETGNTTPGFAGISINPTTLGKCSNPQIMFGGGLEGRKMDDKTFVPEDQKNFHHGTAQNLEIITRAMCDQMLNCGFKNEDKTILDCRALGAAIGPSKGKGIGADQWNSAV
ncbi:hypothetical protein O181_072596, partial [Austropuccinia psidii MF-1]|nr:hypothetical protein [Austropuccinia psidii MF-1]